MKDFRSALVSAIALASALGLTACGGGHQKAAPPATGASLPANLTLAPLQNCPQTAILQQAQAVTLFLPGRNDIAAQISSAHMDGLSGACTLNKKQQAFEIRFTVNFTANNGPANNGEPITLPWFVAITQGNNIVDMQDYTATLKFNGNMSVAAMTSKPITIEVPDAPNSRGLEILAGFKMTPAQLAYASSHPNLGIVP